MPKGAKYGGRTRGTRNKKTAEALSRAEVTGIVKKTIIHVIESE